MTAVAAGDAVPLRPARACHEGRICGASRYRIKPCAAAVGTRTAGWRTGGRAGGRSATRARSGSAGAGSGPATPDSEARLQRAEGTTYATIDLTEAEYRSFYVGFANGALWPLLHFRLGLVEFRREDYEAYRAVNRRFAESLRQAAARRRPDLGARLSSVPAGRGTAPAGRAQPDRVLPAHSRSCRRRCCTHCRAPPICCGRCAPIDVVGFHTHTYQPCVPRLRARDPAGHQDHRRQLHARRSACGFDRRSDRHRRRGLRGDRRACGTQRRDRAAAREPGRTRRWPSASTGSTIPRAWSVASRRSAGCSPSIPEHRRQVSFLQIARALARGVRQLSASAARARPHRRRHQRPVLRIRLGAAALHDQHGAPADLAGFYRCARLGVVTPLRDGMNLVAKEYVAAQDPTDPGVLILSRFAGAAEELDRGADRQSVRCR